ncbi:MAG: hypothetical protein OEZ13_07450 [Spirochaetia bacterium]|nr:hypothetical protein [Spirochaetia bacterium]
MIRHKTFIDSAVEFLQKNIKNSYLFSLKQFVKNLPFAPFAILYKTALKTKIIKRNRLFAPGKTLFYQPFSAAETVLISPFIGLWFEHFKQKADFGVSEINQRSAEPVKFHDCIENIVTVPDNIREKAKFFRKRKYNTVVLLFPYPYYNIAFSLMLAKTVNRLGLNYGAKNPFLSSSLQFNEYNAHLTHQFKTLFEETLLKKTNILPQVFYTADEKKRAEARKLLTSMRVIRFIVCHINYSKENDLNIPAKNISDFVKLLLDKNRLMHVLFYETPENKDYLKEIISKVPIELHRKLQKLENLPYDIMFYVIEKSKFVIGYNSDLTHIGSAAKIKVFSIYGAQNEKIDRPFSSASHSIFIDLPCRPCSKLFHTKRCVNPNQNACLSELTGEILFNEVIKSGF